jgi:hypothetical protein
LTVQDGYKCEFLLSRTVELPETDGFDSAIAASPPRGIPRSVVGVPELLQELRNVVGQHVIDALNHLRPQLLELVEVVRAQKLPVLLHAGEVPWRQVQLLLDLHATPETKVTDSASETVWME